jgi:exodeoxyribonuclease V alpha subunit
MKARYEKLGLIRAMPWSTQEAIKNSRSQFELQLRDIEAGSAALNLGSEAVHLAAEIASFEPDLSDEHRVALILLVMISLAALEEGSTRFPVTGAHSVEPMRRLLGPLCGESFGTDGVERMRLAIEELLSSNSAAGVIGTNPGEYKPLLYLPPFIYQHRSLSAEVALVQRLTALINAQPEGLDEARMREELGRLAARPAIPGGKPGNLSAEQRVAIERAVAGPLTIIAGGPGTGKTSIIVAVLKVLVAGGMGPKQIAMAAPTGKAAFRIGESIQQSSDADYSEAALLKECSEPSTVHRLLGYSPTLRRFRYHHNNPLSAAVVLVDEVSMLDLELMSRLLDALRLGARLILLGDADQLPSVSAGAVFRDLLPPSGAEDSAPLARNCVRLNHSYRLNAELDGNNAIFNLAGAINSGDASIFASAHGEGDLAARDSAEEIEFSGAEWLDAEAPSAAFLERWYSEQVRGDPAIQALENHAFTLIETGFTRAECESIRRIFEDVSRSRMLCVTRVLDSGSERLNSLMHRRATFDKRMSPERNRFIAGEPVMILRNDYERMLFNGDQGLVLRVQRPGYEATLMAIFPRGDNFVAFNVDALKDRLELCYAMAVHKAQGSEFDSVALIMPDKDVPILTREIIYTAVSRARRSVTIIGSKAVIQTGLSRKIERYTGVREQLAQCLKDSQRE